MLRSMSVVPYLDDLHNPSLDEEVQGHPSQYDESYSAGREATFSNSFIIHQVHTKDMTVTVCGCLILIRRILLVY